MAIHPISIDSAGESLMAPSSTVPRSAPIFTTRPNSARPAVAPSATMMRGSSTCSSACSHGRQAVMCTASGVLWMRRVPRRSNRKCFTAFVR